jgi:aminopeptidase N
VIPLQKGGHPVHHVLNVTQAEQTFVFDNVYFQPVPALLCEFSAPVKLEYKWSDQQLTFLMRHARNDFSRWDAAQSLLATYIKLNVNRHQQGQPLSLPVHVADAFRAILLDEKIDPALAAEILTLPSANEIAELFAIIDPIAIAAVREALTRTLAKELADEFLAVYNVNKLASYRVEHADIGKRSLRNTCLRYLAFGDVELADKLVVAQYHQADNMTDALAALSAAVAAQLPCRDALMQEYDDKWHQDGLVMDKWFILQSTSPADNVLETVRGLLNHRSFSMSNPNRVRSLIGAFAGSNPAAFHAEDGSGYQFMVEMLTELNSRNPQVASRLIEPLIRLKRYDAKRQALMRAALEQLKGLENLSGICSRKSVRRWRKGQDSRITARMRLIRAIQPQTVAPTPAAGAIFSGINRGSISAAPIRSYHVSSLCSVPRLPVQPVWPIRSAAAAEYRRRHRGQFSLLQSTAPGPPWPPPH